MNNKLKKILSSTLAVTLATATMFTTGIVVNATELPNVEKSTDAEGNVVVTQTENPTEYNTVAEKVDEALPEVSAEPVLNVNSVEEIDSKDTINETSDSIFKSCRLIITNPTDLDFKEESLGTDNILSVQKYEDKYFVTYRSVYATEKAYNDLTALGLDVEVDVVQDTPEGVEIKDDNGNDITVKDIALTEETRPTESVENVVIQDTQKNEKTIVVAVLDTGLNNEEAIFEDKVIEGKNFVSEQSDVKDLDGHGTTMSRIILESVNEENTNNTIKVMPIKVLNDEGKGTTLSAYKGIKYVIEKKNENPSLDFVINLSMSGIGHSKLLESAINEAYNNNIPVVVSAGNDNKEITEYTPANIDSAFTITSSDKNEDKITKAVYSNYGSEADYTTSGHYEYSRNIDDRKVVTKVDGTSVSSAYVSSYIAMLKQMALSDDNEDDDNLSIIDIDTSLSESAISVDTTLGRGYLARENIHLKKVGEEVEQEQEALPVEETTDISEDIELNSNGVYYVFARSGLNYAIEEDILAQIFIAYVNGDRDIVVNLMCPVFFNKNITINANDCRITINGNNNACYPANEFIGLTTTQIFHIENGANVTISNMAISGRGWGFIKNSEMNGIGALVNVLDSTCTFNNVTFMSAKNHRTWSGDMSKPLGGGTGVNFRNSNITFNGCNFTELSGCAIFQFDSDLSSNVTLNSCGCSNVSELYSQNNPDITWNHTLTINGGNYYVGYCDGFASNYVTYQGCIGMDNRKNSGQHKVDITNATIIAGHPSGGWGTALNMYDVTRGCKIKNSTIKGKPSIEANRNTYVTIDNSTIDSFASNSSYVYSNGINVGSNADKRTCTLSLINNSKVYSPEIGINNFGTTSINKSLVSAFQGIVNEAGFCTLNISNTSKIIGAKNTPGKGDYAAFTSGIINKGVTNISDSTVRDCMSGIINYGNLFEGINISTTTITNSTISNEIGIENYGMCNFNSGQITNCYYGVQNQEGSTFNQNGGNIYNNGYPTGLSQNNCSGDSVNIGILQDGTYNYSAGTITNNSVKLGANKTINLVGNVQNSIALTTALNDRTIGRKLVTASNQTLADSNGGRFRLAYNAPQKNNNGTAFNGVADDPDGNAFCRAGSLIQDNNYSNSAMFLSGKYYVKYNNNLINNNLYIRSVSPEKTFWKENKEFHTGESPGVFLQDNNGAIHDIANTNNGLVFKGWKKPFDNNLYTTNQIFNFDTNSEFTAVWDTNFAINYLGNGATNGKDFKEYNISQGYRFAENPFSKELKGYKDDLLHQKPNAIEFKDKYSHQGWSKNPSATYKDNVYKCGDELDTFKFLVDSLSDGSAYIDDEGQVVVDLNAVWDEYPVINSKEIYLPNNLDNGKYASEKAMLKLAKAIAVDDNDGDSNGKDVSLRIVDFDLDDFKNRGKETHIKLQLEAIDQVGNRTIDYISIVLVETNLNIMEDYGYVRFIDEENYNKRDDSLPDGGQSNGALMKDSSWYLDPERVQIITTGFANIRTLLDDVESNDSYVMRYSFPRSEMIKSNNYKNTYGRGNFKSDEYERINGKGSYQRDFGVRSALDGWCKEFEHCKVK